MRLEKASYIAIKYACLNFHYAKAVPVNTFGYSVFNNNNEWCGVILYGSGASNNLGKQLNLVQGQYMELVRMALNGKHESTSKALALSLKLLPKKLPLIKAIISFADNGQNHYGIIYQATNWYYSGEFKGDKEYYINGKWMHPRSVGSLNGSRAKDKLPKGTIIRNGSSKFRYIYPLDKTLIPLCKSLSKPYPKNAQEVNKDKHDASSIEIGGSNPTLALK
jgi:hypothetical protein